MNNQQNTNGAQKSGTDIQIYHAGENDNNRRLDRILRFLLPDVPLSAIYGFLRKGVVKLNGKKAHPDNRVLCGDEISINYRFIARDSVSAHFSAKQSTKNDDILSYTLDIVFQNEHILILNKPFDIAVHGAENALERAVYALWQNESHTQSLSFTPGPLHRLDRKTTGLIAFSQSLIGAQWFSEAIASHRIVKRYVGLAIGILESEQYWEDYLERNVEKQNTKCFVRSQVLPASSEVQEKGEVCGKIAQTLVRPLRVATLPTGEKLTLIEYEIKTGRTHQIRVQSAHHGFPLWGDSAYNRQAKSCERIYLHARELLIPPDNPIGLPENLQASFPLEFEKKCIFFE